jgi:hypothetical protein
VGCEKAASGTVVRVSLEAKQNRTEPSGEGCDVKETSNVANDGDAEAVEMFRIRKALVFTTPVLDPCSTQGTKNTFPAATDKKSYAVKFTTVIFTEPRMVVNILGLMVAWFTVGRNRTLAHGRLDMFRCVVAVASNTCVPGWKHICRKSVEEEPEVARYSCTDVRFTTKTENALSDAEDGRRDVLSHEKRTSATSSCQPVVIVEETKSAPVYHDAKSNRFWDSAVAFGNKVAGFRPPDPESSVVLNPNGDEGTNVAIGEEAITVAVDVFVLLRLLMFQQRTP